MFITTEDKKRNSVTEQNPDTGFYGNLKYDESRKHIIQMLSITKEQHTNVV